MLYFYLFYIKFPYLYPYQAIFSNKSYIKFIAKKIQTCYNAYMENDTILYHFDNQFLKEPLRFHDIYLIQIGRRYCGENDIVKAHLHGKWFELTVVTDGDGTISTNGTEYAVTANDIYLSFPYELHEIRTDKEKKLKYDYFSFYCEDGNLADDLEKIRLSYIGNCNRIFHDEKISTLIRTGLHELRSDDRYKSEILESVFRQILIYIIRDANHTPQATLNTSDANLLCFKIMNYIDTNIYTMRKLTEISDNLGYNYDYISGLFKKITGQKLSDYFINRKLETTRFLLLENNIKISEIASIANYANTFIFSKAFKHKYGISPLKYKQQYGK